jgi:hypothetical protein
MDSHSMVNLLQLRLADFKSQFPFQIFLPFEDVVVVTSEFCQTPSADNRFIKIVQSPREKCFEWLDKIVAEPVPHQNVTTWEFCNKL